MLLLIVVSIRQLILPVIASSCFYLTFPLSASSIPITPNLSACTVEGKPKSIVYLPNLAFDTMLFGLALYKGIQHLKFYATLKRDTSRGHSRTAFGNGVGWKGQKAIDVLLRDSMLYYTVCAPFFELV